MRIQPVTAGVVFFSLLPLLAATGARGATLPCRPCAGLVVEDPASWLGELTAAPALEPEDRFYLAWTLDAAGEDGAAALAARVAQAGGVPWLRVRFASPSPLQDNLGSLEAELTRLAATVRQAPANTHYQILWAAPGERLADYAFLFKRAVAAITGAQPEARVVTAPFPADPELLQGLYDEEVAAYLDGLALLPASDDALAAAVDRAIQLDPGKPLVLDGPTYPTPAALALAEAAAAAEARIDLTLFDARGRDPGKRAGNLSPLKVLAREFQGDLAYDQYSTPFGARRAWSFVRGEDLGLRVIVERSGTEPDRVEIQDSTLRQPRRVDLATGEARDLFGLSRSATGLSVPLEGEEPVAVLRFDRPSLAELAGEGGLAEEVTITSMREMPVAEVLRRLQASEDGQRRRIESYTATATSHLRFQVGTGAQSLEVSFIGPYYFLQGEGFDWVWEQLLVNGVRWRDKTIPEIPLIQPEKAAALPVEISFTREYRYSLRGTQVVGGRDCWVVDFEPAVAVEPGATLYKGAVWVDRELYVRVKTNALQLGLEGEVLSNEETTLFTPLDAAGRPAPWERDSYFLPTRVVGQQLWSLLSATTVVEREVLLEGVRVNPEDFEARRQASLASELTMVRDTDKGLRYLVPDPEGEGRIVQEDFDLSRRFVVGGVFHDDSQDFPIPLLGGNWLWFDWRGTGTQANVFFAGPLLNVAVTNPSFRGSKFDLGFDVFALALAGTDTLFRDGMESSAEDVEILSPNIDLKVGRPFGAYAKLDLEYELNWVKFDGADDTAEEFVLPEDHLLHAVSLVGRYNRRGYRLRLRGTYNLRGSWDFWGLPGNDEFRPEQEEFLQWGASVGKTWHLPKFRKLGLELEYVDGSDLDRFSKYGFGVFSDQTVHGYQSDKVRAEKALVAHLSYGVNLGDLFRLDLVGDAAWATDEPSGLDQELLAGVGLVGTVVGPWKTVVNLDVGVALDGPDDGVTVFLAFLKLFK